MKIRNYKNGIEEIEARNKALNLVKDGYVIVMLCTDETVQTAILLDYEDLKMATWETIAEAHMRLFNNSKINIVADEDELQDGLLADTAYWNQLNKLIEAYHKNVSVNCCYMDIYSV